MNHLNLSFYFQIIICILLLSCNVGKDANETESKEEIKIYSDNPFYWEYNGLPVMLIGGTKDDNLFQIDELKSHLELLQSVGGNYIRCTMSSRDEGNFKPYLKNENGLFDLEKPNPVYWDKLDSLLSYCAELDIIVQIEIWATYDFYAGSTTWANNPFNPLLNCNYTAESSGLPEERTLPAQSGASAFFNTVPDLDNNLLVLEYQKKFVDKLLSITFKYNNVLYSIDNETTANYLWGKYWAAYLQKQAKDAGKNIYITEMWDCWDPTGGEVENAVVQKPELSDWFAQYQDPKIHETANFSFSLNDTESYQFLDVSNNNAQKGETHYRTALWVRNAVQKSGKIRPINNVKIYGGDRDSKGNIWAGNHKDGIDRFWRDVFAGHAAVRFHRPPSGIGLNDEAQAQIKSLRMLTNKVNFFNLVPDTSLLSEREDNEAFCLANKNKKEVVVYFTGSGAVKIGTIHGKYKLMKIINPQVVLEELDPIDLPGTVENKSEENCVFILKSIDN